MKTNSFTTALLVMAMAVISNAAAAAGMNDMISEPETPLCMVEYATSSTANALNSKLLVDVSNTDRVEAHSCDYYSHRFYEGVEVFIAVKGDGDTDLDLYVYDENDNLIDSDEDTGDECLCSFTPRWDGKFTIKIKNHGRVYNKYQIRCVQ